MNAKDKAIEIYNNLEYHIKYNCQPSTVNGVVKQCAIIHVKGIIEELEKTPYKLLDSTYKTIGHYQQVLTELNQM